MAVHSYLPRAINQGSLLTTYSLPALEERVARERVVLPICSFGTPTTELSSLAPLVLPPLFHEALPEPLKQQLASRIETCFPYLAGSRKRESFRGEFEILELPAQRREPPISPKVLAFSVDTAVEEHGPHLPLCTDTIQSYGVLEALARESAEVFVGPPVDYGHLTWGLPFGLSIDLTPPLLTEYVANYVNAMLEWLQPEALYVVDVHGSIVHRNAIQAGLEQSRCTRWRFRWLHEPLVEFAGERGDQHAGGVETAIVEHIDASLIDNDWFPARIDEIASAQMAMDEAIALSSDLPAFVERVEREGLNGIVGDIHNYARVDGELMFQRMLAVARSDLAELRGA